jgi:cytoskeleton protein RodZ
LAVVALLVGALILLFAPFSPTTEDLAVVTSSAGGPSQSSLAVSAPSDNAAQEGTAASSVVVAPTSEALLNSSPAAANQSPASARTNTALDTSSPTIEGSGAATGLLMLKARNASSWVEVIDGAGVVQVRKTLVAGEVLGVSGVLPLAVVLGRADAVDVQVRGQPFDMAGRAKDSIARFEVK